MSCDDNLCLRSKGLYFLNLAPVSTRAEYNEVSTDYCAEKNCFEGSRVGADGADEADEARGRPKRDDLVLASDLLLSSILI